MQKKKISKDIIFRFITIIDYENCQKLRFLLFSIICNLLFVTLIDFDEIFFQSSLSFRCIINMIDNFNIILSSKRSTKSNQDKRNFP